MLPKLIKNTGADKIFVITTHGLFVNDDLQKLKACGLIEKVICTDTHKNVIHLNDDFMEVRSIAGLICSELCK